MPNLGRGMRNSFHTIRDNTVGKKADQSAKPENGTASQVPPEKKDEPPKEQKE